jgi:hypothetical protein
VVGRTEVVRVSAFEVDGMEFVESIYLCIIPLLVL